MWAKLTSALKPRQTNEEHPSDGIGAVLEQHPVFHHEDPSGQHNQHSPPPSPSKRAMFKRLSKNQDSIRSSSSLRLPGLPKRVKSAFNLNNASQSSLSPTVESHQSSDSQSSSTRHRVYPSQDTIRSFANSLRRPSLDLLRQTTKDSRPSIDSPVESRGSVRSILRDPNTPGTGQNVRFFSRDVYKVISSDESAEGDFLSPPVQTRVPEHTSFMDRLNQSSPTNASTPSSAIRLSPPSVKSRPPLAGVFAPLTSNDEDNEETARVSMSEGTKTMSMSGPASSPSLDDSFDMPHQLELPPFPPGLGFDVASPVLDAGVDLDLSLSAESSGPQDGYDGQMTSTPFKSSAAHNGKGKEKEGSIKEESEEVQDQDDQVTSVFMPVVADEKVFHAKEESTKPAAPSHDRSRSFSFGQTVFYSMNKSSGSSTMSPAYPSSDHVRPSEDGSMDSSRASSPNPGKLRSRTVSDSVFQNMLRASFTKPPEADINDVSSADLIMFSPPTSNAEPDPFNANANTYYTPQTMIPTTPPAGAPKHARKASKEESIIFSLQTQLTLQTELCGQYEADLRARDEVVELLEKKIADMEKEDGKRKVALRQWKKKVQDLERTCRLLEEEVDSSRQENMERSVMDEASGEALRMLHRQIANLEREKKEWNQKEQRMKEEIGSLESVVKERTQDIANLKETLSNRDESDRELKEGIREAKEQIDLLGNVSVGVIDEEELRRLNTEREQRAQEERQQYRAAEMSWQQERAELTLKLETMQMEKTNLEEQLDILRQQMKTKEDELEVLKNELEAQWGHSERATEKMNDLMNAKVAAEEEAARLERERDAVAHERDELRQKYEEVEDKINSLELEWNESENRNTELKARLQSVWEQKEALQREREEIEEQLGQERDHSEGLTQVLQQSEDRIAQLERERQVANDDVMQLEERIRLQGEEIAEYSQKVLHREREAERLRKEIDILTSEHTRKIDDQSRALKETIESRDRARQQLEQLVHQKAQTDIEFNASKDRLNALEGEVEQLRKQVHELQQESADKEVKVLQFTKQHAQDKEDIQGLNIALDAKQQELELYKRKVAMKSKSINTPALSKTGPSAFNNTPITSRPPSRTASVISDSGSVKSDSAKVSTLGRSSRANAVAGSTSTGAITKRTEGPMRSASLKSRSSLSSTPTPSARPTLTGRSSTVKPSAQPTTTASQRVASSALANKSKSTRPSIVSPPPSISEYDEKENVDASTKDSRRRSLIPATL